MDTVSSSTGGYQWARCNHEITLDSIPDRLDSVDKEPREMAGYNWPYIKPVERIPIAWFRVKVITISTKDHKTELRHGSLVPFASGKVERGWDLAVRLKQVKRGPSRGQATCSVKDPGSATGMVLDKFRIALHPLAHPG